MSLVTQISSGLVRLTTEFKAIRTLISGSGTGDLSGLTTTDKTSLVAAINEVDATGGAGGASDLEALTDVDLTAPASGDFLRHNGSGQFVNSPSLATETATGVVELATTTEASTGTDTVRAVTPAGVAAALAALVDAAPGTMDTLNELAEALGDDPNFAASVTTALAGKQPLDSDLTAIAALASAANKMLYATGAQTWALADLTAFARTILDDADAATARGTLSVYSQAEIGDPTTDFVAVINTALA